MSTKYKKIEAIKEKLMKFLDPKPEYSGMTARGLAERLFKIATAENLCSKCGDASVGKLCEQCEDQIASFNS